MRRKRSVITDLLTLGGLGAILFGLAQWSAPAAWVFGGLCSLTIAWSQSTE